MKGRKDFENNIRKIKRGILLLCLVMYACLAVGIDSKRYFGDLFIYLFIYSFILYNFFEIKTRFPEPKLLL